MSKQHLPKPTDSARSHPLVENTQAGDPSDPKYRPPFETVSTGFALCQAIRDPSGKVIDCRFLELNPAFEQLTGVHPQEAVGKAAQQVFPGLQPGWVDTYQPAINSGQTIRVDWFIPGLDRWFELTAFFYGNDQFVAHYEDITARRQAREAQRQSEASLQQALDIAQLGTWSWNLLTNEGYLDARGAELIGLAPGYLTNVAQAQMASIHPDDMARTEAHVRAGIAKGVPFGLSYRVIHPDQRVRHIRSRFQVVADPTGSPVQLMGTNLDVTAEYEQTIALRQSQQKQAFLLALTDALYPLTDPGAIETTAVRLLGQYLGDCPVQYSERINEPGLLTQYYGSHQPSRRGQVQIVANVATDPLHSLAERKVLLAAQIGAYITVPLVKQERWVAILTVHSSQARSWTSSEVEGVQETAERTWTARERARTQQALSEANRHKDEFLALLAHELRNPLAPLSNGLQLLAQTPQDDALLGAHLPVMNRQMGHLLRMVDDLLDVSRISRGTIELRKQRINLVEVVSQAVEPMRSLYTGSNRQLSIQLPDRPLYVDGDPTRLHQVVTNLLTNGLRYTHEGGQVWLSLTQRGEQALLRVADNGIGLTADQVATIFGLFVQVNKSWARSHGGLGVGLSLVQALVGQHGGRVEAHSGGLEQGSEFVVYLPVLPA